MELKSINHRDIEYYFIILLQFKNIIHENLKNFMWVGRIGIMNF